MRQKYICHLCELVYCKQWQFFNDELTRLANDDVRAYDNPPFRYKDFEFDWGIFVWHKRCELIDCPYDEGALKFLFERMVTNAE